MCFACLERRQWLSRVTGLLVDKNGDLRKRASEAVEAVYHDVDAHTVVAFAQHSTGAEGVSLLPVPMAVCVYVLLYHDVDAHTVVAFAQHRR